MWPILHSLHADRRTVQPQQCVLYNFPSLIYFVCQSFNEAPLQFSKPLPAWRPTQGRHIHRCLLISTAKPSKWEGRAACGLGIRGCRGT